jgi:hypothetical protein
MDKSAKVGINIHPFEGGRLGAFAMHMSMVLLLLMFLSPPPRGAGPMALMLGHEWYVGTV